MGFHTEILIKNYSTYPLKTEQNKDEHYALASIFLSSILLINEFLMV